MVKVDIKSPVTKSDNVSVLRVISSKKVIDLYKNEIGIDVSTIFKGCDEIKIVKCKDTGYRFYYPESISGDKNFYENLQKVKGEKNYYSLWRWEYDMALKHLAQGAKVLDIGCGSGNFLERLKEITTQAIGLEFNNMAIEKCKAKELLVYDIDVEKYSHIAKNRYSFDVVCTFQVLEHIFDVNRFLNSCINLLKPGGKLIIGIPNNNPYLYKFDLFHTLNLPPHHMGIWNKKSLKRLQEYFPLCLEKILVEPNYNFEYWLNIQVKKWIRVENISKFLKRIKLLRIISSLGKFTEGRNLLVVFIKR